MPLINRTFDELNATSIQRLLTLGYTDAQYKGTGVRDIVESVNINLADFFNVSINNLNSQYLSQAQADQLDGLGQLLGTPRYAGEVDQSYKARLVVAASSSAGTNLSYLTQQLLSLTTVKSVVVRTFTQGIGSLTFYLLGTAGLIDAATLATAQATIDNLSAAGAYTVVKSPTQLLINMTGQIAVTTGSSRATLTATAVSAIAAYLNSLSLGGQIVIDQIIRAVLNSDPNIIDFTLLTLSTTSSDTTTEQLVANFTPQFDQQLLPGSILIS